VEDTPKPSVFVGLHRSLRWILLVHSAHTVEADGLVRGNMPYDDEEKFGLEEFEREGVDRLRTSFALYSTRVGVPSTVAGSFPSAKWRTMLRDHRLVVVTQHEPEVWSFEPLAQISRGVTGCVSPEDCLLWDATTSERLFHRALWFGFGAAELGKKRTATGCVDGMLMPRNA
jgi:hypothetical protein